MKGFTGTAGHHLGPILALSIAVAVLGTSRRAWPADHTNLEEGLPVEVIDAYPLEYLGREVQVRAQYRYTAEGEHQAILEPRFDVGFPYDGQFALKAPLITRFGENGTEFDLGRMSFDFLYNFNQETLTVPALALVMGVEAPDTQVGGSFDPLGRMVVTKMIPGSALWQRLHLNASFQGNVDRAEDERAWGYLLAVGYDVRLSATMIGVIDAVRDQPLRDGPASNFGEMGVLVQIEPLLAIALGGGAGASDEGDFVTRGTAGFQWFAF